MWSTLLRLLDSRTSTTVNAPARLQTLRGTAVPIRWETGSHSRRFAAEEALREYQASTRGDASRDTQDAFIHLIVGRGFKSGASAS